MGWVGMCLPKAMSSCVLQRAPRFFELWHLIGRDERSEIGFFRSANTSCRR
jgi:hypothetical protein